MMNNNNEQQQAQLSTSKFFPHPPRHSSYPLCPSHLSLPLPPFDHCYTMAVAKLLRDCKKCK